jgi:hypothetical protein
MMIMTLVMTITTLVMTITTLGHDDHDVGHDDRDAGHDTAAIMKSWHIFSVCTGPWRIRFEKPNFVNATSLADSGINLVHQRTIAVERFAVLDFHRSLPNARLQSDVPRPCRWRFQMVGGR